MNEKIIGGALCGEAPFQNGRNEKHSFSYTVATKVKKVDALVVGLEEVVGR